MTRATPKPHPRLYATKTDIERLKKPVRRKFLKPFQKKLEKAADAFLDSAGIDDVPPSHNGHLVRARRLQNRVVTLLVRWFQTDEPRYRDAALEQLFHLETWREWSWNAWRDGNSDPNAIFDLSYGENSATLSIAYDWLYDSLLEPEREALRNIARKRSFAPFLNDDKPYRDFWLEKKDSNWNTVCAGGAGMLALAMLDEIPEAKAVLRRAEKSIVPYFEHVQENGGGWPEGIGYWAYGMRYGFMYLLSWENAMGHKHPLMNLSGLKKTLSFPLDFCPNGAPSSFGDVNSFLPLPVHFAMSRRLNRDDVVSELERMLSSDPDMPKRISKSWPSAAEIVLLYDAKKRSKPKTVKPFSVRYKNIDWYALADRRPDPNLALTVRGGTTEVPHGHKDLSSFNCVVGDETLLSNIGVSEYLDTTFSSRRYELFEMTPGSKNVVLINGVGITKPSVVKSSLIDIDGVPAVRIDATAAYGTTRSDRSAAKFAGRLVVLLDNKAAIVIDRIETEHNARFEARIHSPADVKTDGDTAVVSGENETLGVRFAADRSAVLQTAVPALTSPGKCFTSMCWMAEKLGTEIVFAALLTPGGKPGKIVITTEGKRIVVEARIGKREKRLTLTARLKPVRSR